jgi:hypothetical protein
VAAVVDKWSEYLLENTGIMTAGLVPPRVESIEFDGPWTIKVHFNEPMLDDEAFTTIENYVITKRGPGVIPTIQSIVGADPDGEGNPTAAVLTISKATAGTQYIVTVSIDVKDADDELGVNPLHNSADDYAPSQPATFTATALTRTSIRIDFSEDVHGSGLLDPESWDVVKYTRLDIVDTVNVEDVTENSPVTVWLGRPLTGNAPYRVTVEDVFDEGENPVDVDGAMAMFEDDAAVPTSREGILPALTGALGRQIADLIEPPTSRLVTPLSATADNALLETCLDFEDSGYALIGDELVTYSARDGHRLMGLGRNMVIDPIDDVARPVDVREKPIGTIVRDANGVHGRRGETLRGMLISKATASQLWNLGRMYGFQRPFPEMTTEDYREYLLTQMYLARGSHLSLFRVLKAMFGWAEQSGTGTTLDDGIYCPNLAWTTTLNNRWIMIGGRRCLVRSAYPEDDGASTRFVFRPDEGPFWQSPYFGGAESVEYSILAFTVTYMRGWEHVSAAQEHGPLDCAGHLRVDLFVPAGTTPYTYLMHDAELISDGRPVAGKVGWYGHPGAERGALYLLKPYKIETERVLTNVVPAGVVVDCRILPP